MTKALDGESKWPLLKRLEGLPGDFIVPADFPPRSTNSLGRLMPSVLLPGVIPPGMVLALADDPGSFESRYFGFVPLENLRRVKAVWIWN